MKTSVQKVEVELYPIAPYNLNHALEYLASSSSSILEKIEDNQVYRRAIVLANKPILLTLRTIGTVEQPRLLLEIQGQELAEPQVAAATSFINRIFMLQEDPTEFYALAQADPMLGKIINHFHGLRPVLIAAPYEALLWAIIGQQINISFARRLKHTLVGLGQEKFWLGETEFQLVPRPETVAGMSEDTLRANQFSRQKTNYLINVSKAIVEGHLDLESLDSKSQEDRLTDLIIHKGIGRWTAEYVLMRGYGEKDIIPAADIGLRTIMGRSYRLGRHASEQEVRDYAEQWAGWRGWATFFWWLALQAKLEL